MPAGPSDGAKLEVTFFVPPNPEPNTLPKPPPPRLPNPEAAFAAKGDAPPNPKDEPGPLPGLGPKDPKPDPEPGPEELPRLEKGDLPELAKAESPDVANAEDDVRCFSVAEDSGSDDLVAANEDLGDGSVPNGDTA